MLPFCDGCSEYSLDATGQCTAHWNRFLSHMRRFFHGRDVTFIVWINPSAADSTKCCTKPSEPTWQEARGATTLSRMHDTDHLSLHPLNTCRGISLINNRPPP